MDINEILGISIVGAILTGAVAMIKAKFGIEGYQTKVLTILLSMLVGGTYVMIRSTPYFQTILGVLVTSSTVYALLRK